MQIENHFLHTPRKQIQISDSHTDDEGKVEWRL